MALTDATSETGRRRRRGCLWFLALCAGALLVVFLLSLPTAIRQAREASRLSDHKNRMKLVLSEIRQYDDAFRHLTAPCEKNGSGECTLSWRVAVLFFTGGVPLNWRPSPGDGWTAPVRPEIAAGGQRLYCPKDKTDTDILGVTGNGTPFGGPESAKFGDLDPDTILLIENCRPGIDWRAPIEFDVDALDGSAGEATWREYTAACGEGFYVGFADGFVFRISSQVPLAVIKRFFTIEGAKEADRETDLGWSLSPCERPRS